MSYVTEPTSDANIRTVFPTMTAPNWGAPTLEFGAAVSMVFPSPHDTAPVSHVKVIRATPIGAALSAGATIVFATPTLSARIVAPRPAAPTSRVNIIRPTPRYAVPIPGAKIVPPSGHVPALSSNARIIHQEMPSLYGSSWTSGVWNIRPSPYVTSPTLEAKCTTTDSATTSVVNSIRQAEMSSSCESSPISGGTSFHLHTQDHRPQASRPSVQLRTSQIQPQKGSTLHAPVLKANMYVDYKPEGKVFFKTITTDPRGQ